MAAAALTEEQLQNSLATSEDDAEFEEDDELSANIMAENDASYAANNQLQNGLLAEQEDDEEQQEGDNSDEEMLSEIATGDMESEDEEEGDVDMAESPEHGVEQDTEEDEVSEEEDGDEEGVGAVKIQPKKSAEDEDVATGSEEDDDESVVSVDDDNESKDSTEAEVEIEWEPTAEEEEEEPTNPNRCIFCHRDEENDPSEEFENYLACGVCGDNAHRQCARDAIALNSDDETVVWYCPDCVTNRLVPEPEEIPLDVEIEEVVEDAAARRISRDKLAGDLLPSRRAIKPDSHSMFNQLIAPDDPMDGSRLLRKRKASTDVVEPVVEETIGLRRRTRDQSSNRPLAPILQATDTVKANGFEAKPLALLTNGTEAAITPRSSRSLRPKIPTLAPKSRILTSTKQSLIVALKVDGKVLQDLTDRPQKIKKKKKSRPTAASRATASAPAALVTTTSEFTPSLYAAPFYSVHEKEVDELKSKPYGGVLSEQEADTSLTLPRDDNRRRFDEARQKAEEEWKIRVAEAAEVALASGIRKPRKVSGPASQIEYIEFGQYQIDIWYAAPYPEEYSRNKALFICEFCLKYMESDIVAWRHKTKCPWKHPPGDEIYRDGKVMIFEVDGRKNPLYCQNLCLLAKLFLGSKTLYYDVEPFLFYVMTEYDELGCHFVGYFSKEKRPSSQNNVSCILVLPIHQRKGYGHLLIDFSYLLTRVERKTGSPEKPLSDMGLVSYRNYWRLVLCYHLRGFRPGDKIPSIKQISDDMGLTPDDVISALDALGALIRDPQTGVYAMKLQTDYYHEVVRQHEIKGYARLNPKGLVWTPYIMGRGNTLTFEHAPPLNTIAPREEDEDGTIEQSRTSSIGTRDFDMNNSINGDTNVVTDSLGMLTTNSGKSAGLTGSEGGSSSSIMNGFARKPSYFEAAASIPATRFVVFPPVPTTKARGTPRPSVSRPSASRPRATPRTAPRRQSSGATPRRSTIARPRTSTRRKSGGGGTGRGPGRWPKGTKKTDFSNPISGPGLPPRMLKQRSRLGNEVLLGDEEEDEIDENNTLEDYEEEEEDPDAIVYATPAVKKRKNAPRGGQGLGKPLSIGNAMGKGKTIVPSSSVEEDDIMPDVEDELDVDAEGEVE